MRQRKARSGIDAVVAGGVLLVGFAIAYYYGWRTVEMIDGGLVESPAWRIANGQVPYRDFGVNQGLSADVTLALAMLVLGPTLTASVVHVAVCNAVAAALAFVLGRCAGLPRLGAALFAVATGVIFYPPQGLVMPMQQGALGILAALTLAFWEARRPADARGGGLIRGGIGVSLAFAFFGKITLGLFAPAVVLTLWETRPRRLLAKLAAVALGGGLCFVALWVWAGADALAARRMWIYLIALPWEFGGERFAFGVQKALVIYELAPTPSFVLGFAALPAVIALARGLPPVGGRGISPLRTAGIGLLVLVGNIAYARIAHWNPNTLMQLVFVGNALLAAALWRLTLARAEAPAPAAGEARLFARILLGLFLFTAAYDGWWIDANMNQHKGIRNLDLTQGHRLTLDPSLVFPEIKGAQFYDKLQLIKGSELIGAAAWERSLRQTRARIDLVRRLPYPVLTSGIDNDVVIYAGKVPVLPVVYVQPGAASPYRESATYAFLLDDLRRNIVRFEVGGVLFSPATYQAFAADLAARPDLFCAVREEPAASAWLAEFCPAMLDRPDAVPLIGHVLGFDGPRYR